MISVKNLVKKYGSGELELTVLRDLTFTIDDGDFVAIVGPSGAGKSTLLYQLSLLDDPTEGEIRLGDIETSGLTEAGKTAFRLHNLGYVFQDYALLPELTALENVALPMLMQGMALPVAEEKARRALVRMGLGDRERNLPSQLSGGQQQRVSIARAIAHEPRILFADEPTANLDSASAGPVIESFLELHREGQTIIMVTHEEEYAAMAHRVIMLKDGVIVSDERQG